MSCSACSAELPPTDFTIGIDEPSIVAERAARAADFPALKIKCGGPADLATLRAVREVFAGPIRVDANTGWTPDDARAAPAGAVGLGVELIEQPFPARAPTTTSRWLQERSPLPIVADESCVFPEDLDGLGGVVAGVNVKLAKCGGIGPARADARPGRASCGFRTFLGCMEETSVGIAASAVVASPRRLGRPRRQPAARRRPVRGSRPGTGQALDPCRSARTRDRPPAELNRFTLVPHRRSANARSCG